MDNLSGPNSALENIVFSVLVVNIASNSRQTTLPLEAYHQVLLRNRLGSAVIVFAGGTNVHRRTIDNFA